MNSSPDNKALGAYYTPADVASTLVEWATGGDRSLRVLDPSCGDGRFLVGLENATGVDVDGAALEAAKALAPGARLVRSDFFAWAAEAGEQFDAVVGNPPFIRYQRFSGETRSRALQACVGQGVKLTALASSWAPFVVAAAGVLRRGGSLAMVVPAEISNAVYARPVVQFLVEQFRVVRIHAIREKLFPHLSEDCWLLMAEGRGEELETVQFARTEKFEGKDTRWLTEDLSVQEVEEFSWRLRPFLLPPEVRRVYRRLAEEPGVSRLGDLVSLGIGYVTGANDFFHLRPSEAEALEIPRSVLRPALRANRDLPARDLTQVDVDAWGSADKPYLLLDLNDIEPSPEVAAYLDSSRGLEVRTGYKCRNRTPWYAVPDVRVPDGFLSTMSYTGPRLVGNSAGCVCTNSVHAVFTGVGVNIDNLILLWDNALTALSAELEGHPLGGGMLKVEPREAREVLLPFARDLSTDEATVAAFGLQVLRRWRYVGDS